MAKFEVSGLTVTHTARPRFRATFAKAADGSYHSGEPHGSPPVEWQDKPPADARLLARLMRETGDALAADLRRDWIQDAVIARVAELGITAYEVAKRTQGRVSEQHVGDYLNRRKSCGSHKLQHVLAAVGLRLTS